MNNRPVVVPGSYFHLLIIESVKETLKGDLSDMMRSNYQHILDGLVTSYKEHEEVVDDIEDPNIRPFGR